MLMPLASGRQALAKRHDRNAGMQRRDLAAVVHVRLRAMKTATS
jgi:hypothetical protein